MRFARVLALVAAVAAVVVPDALALRFTDDSYFVPEGFVGRPFSHWFKGAGGCGPGLPYQFSVLSGLLPPGVSLRRDGLLSGTPTEAGSWTFWVQLSDEDPPSANWCRPSKSERAFTVHVSPPRGRLGSPYAAKLGAGLEEPRRWSLVSGDLPAGLSLSAGGIIAGTPQAAGSFPLRLSVVNEQRRNVIVDVTIVVRGPRLAIVTTGLRPAQVGRRYRTTVLVRGAIGRVSLTVVSGRFPVGIRLDQQTGVLAGTPRTPGVFRFSIEARDADGASVRRAFVLSVRR